MEAGSSGNLTKNTKSYDIQLKFLTIGDSTVGKSTLIGRFVDGKFQTNLMSTIGVDFKVKLVEIDGLQVRLQIWDTAGQERYRAITSSYFRDAMGVLMIFDVTNPKSFESINTWAQRVEQNCPDEVVRVIVGNKCDLTAKRKVTPEEAKAMAAKHKCQYFETSAKIDEGVSEAFMTVAREVKAKKVQADLEAEIKKKRGSTLAATGGSGTVSLTEAQPYEKKKPQCCAH